MEGDDGDIALSPPNGLPIDLEAPHQQLRHRDRLHENHLHEVRVWREWRNQEARKRITLPGRLPRRALGLDAFCEALRLRNQGHDVQTVARSAAKLLLLREPRDRADVHEAFRGLDPDLRLIAYLKAPFLKRKWRWRNIQRSRNQYAQTMITG